MKDVRFVVKALNPVCGRWEGMGLAAGVQQLDVIKRNCGNSKLINFCIEKHSGRLLAARHVA
jgi:hypothetical protein